ncbi:hypothetical protein BZA70DRAFT_270498 [Myxozyma melibiosi]|uniref:Uncharacterized protein n=1 Tax=Myxozyma melibiosi TaxID=54550 RepID=A0ABR1FB77_9ASCO
MFSAILKIIETLLPLLLAMRPQKFNPKKYDPSVAWKLMQAVALIVMLLGGEDPAFWKQFFEVDNPDMPAGLRVTIIELYIRPYQALLEYSKNRRPHDSSDEEEDTMDEEASSAGADEAVLHEILFGTGSGPESDTQATAPQPEPASNSYLMSKWASLKRAFFPTRGQATESSSSSELPSISHNTESPSNSQNIKSPSNGQNMKLAAIQAWRQALSAGHPYLRPTATQSTRSAVPYTRSSLQPTPSDLSRPTVPLARSSLKPAPVDMSPQVDYSRPVLQVNFAREPLADLLDRPTYPSVLNSIPTKTSWTRPAVSAGNPYVKPTSTQSTSPWVPTRSPIKARPVPVSHMKMPTLSTFGMTSATQSTHSGVPAPSASQSAPTLENRRTTLNMGKPVQPEKPKTKISHPFSAYSRPFGRGFTLKQKQTSQDPVLQAFVPPAQEKTSEQTSQDTQKAVSPAPVFSTSRKHFCQSEGENDSSPRPSKRRRFTSPDSSPEFEVHEFLPGAPNRAELPRPSPLYGEATAAEFQHHHHESANQYFGGCGSR